MKAALVLGGGGAKALAHVGAWKALQERGVEVTHIIATSMGAVIGAALAAGADPAALLRTAQTLTRKDFASFRPLNLLKGIFATSLFEPHGLKRTIARLVPTTRFEELKLPFTVTATDLDSGELVLFGTSPHSGTPLHEALYASCALPLYFPPATIDGRRLAEGGLRAVLPIHVAAGLAVELVVAVHVGPGFDEVTPPGVRSLAPPLVRAHGEAERIMMAAQTDHAIATWPAAAPRLVVVRAVTEREATFAVGHAKRHADAGYSAMTQARLDA